MSDLCVALGPERHHIVLAFAFKPSADHKMHDHGTKV